MYQTELSYSIDNQEYTQFIVLTTCALSGIHVTHVYCMEYLRTYVLWMQSAGR